MTDRLRNSWKKKWELINRIYHKMISNHFESHKNEEKKKRNEQMNLKQQ